MTYSFTVGGSRKPTAESPGYHPFSADEATAFDAAVQRLADDLKAAGLSGSISGSRPGTQAEYDARPRITYTPTDGTPQESLDTSNAGFSKTF